MNTLLYYSYFLKVNIIKCIEGFPFRSVNGTVPKTLSFLITFIVFGCVTPLDQEPGDFTDHLVVEGFITNDYGLYTMNITRVTRFAGVSDGGSIGTVEDAIVTITDQNGNVTPLDRAHVLRKELYNEPPSCAPIAKYITTLTGYTTRGDFRGEVGNTYTLEIQIDGKIYQSEPQTMLPTPPISDIQFQFKELPSTDPIVNPSGVEILASWHDPPNQENYYSWKINGIYLIYTPPLGGTACCLYDPNDGGATMCWIIENDISGSELAYSDEQVDGQQVSLKVGFIEDDGLRFASPLGGIENYFVEVEQYRISKEAYEFFNQIENLQEIDGEIFDPLPQSIRGNIFNIQDPNEIVIGFFGAFSVETLSAYVNDTIFPYKQRYTEPCGDCRIRAGAVEAL